MSNTDKAKYVAIAAKHTPKDAKIVFWDSPNGETNSKTRVAKVPYPDTPETLQVYLHEMGHLHQNPDWVFAMNTTGRRYLVEYDAEMYSKRALEAEGLALDPSQEDRQRAYVAANYNVFGGREAPDPEVVRWVRAAHDPDAVTAKMNSLSEGLFLERLGFKVFA